MIPEYDIHRAGMRVDDALAELERIISDARFAGPPLFAVVTGHGSRGGTSRIREAVLAACRRYRAQNHIRGFLAGEFAADVCSPAHDAFPDAWGIPARYKRSPNPGVVFICV